MSSNWGAIQPLMDKIQALKDMGGKAVDALSHPGQMMHDMIAPTVPDAHQQAIDQMNKQANDERVRQASQSFVHPDVTTMSKPLPRGK